MADEKFNWKSLFLNEVEEDIKETAAKEEAKPKADSSQNAAKSTQKFPDSPPPKAAVSKDTLDTIVSMYESGFESLNQPGYDFYEFFKAIEAVGTDEPSAYKMAFTMAQTVDKKINKEALLIHANFYITEINKVHDHYMAQGKSKKAEIQNALKAKKENLSHEVSSLEKKLTEIQKQIVSKKQELESVDENLIVEISEIDQKINCNDIARSKIQDAISRVVNGIKNNL